MVQFQLMTSNYLFTVLSCGIVNDLIFEAKLAFKHSQILFTSMLSWRSFDIG